MEVRPSNFTHKSATVQPHAPMREPARQAAAGDEPVDLRGVDGLELSPDVNKAEEERIERRIEELRDRIARDEYVTEDKIDVVVDLLYRELLRNPPAAPGAE